MMELYKEKADIIKWLKQYDIHNYELVKNKKYGFVVNVAGSVNLHNKGLEHIAVKFNRVSEDFDCSLNNLESLNGSPSVVGRHFLCNHNKLQSLKGSPQIVGENFLCYNNRLINLQFASKQIEGIFNCSDNCLTSLVFIPESLKKEFYCNNNPDLGYIQNINSFKLIQEEHLKHKDRKETFDKLDVMLENKTPPAKPKKI